MTREARLSVREAAIEVLCDLDEPGEELARKLARAPRDPDLGRASIAGSGPR